MDNQQLQKVKVKRLAHVGLWTTDVPAQARFYRQALGFDQYNSAEDTTSSTPEAENLQVFLSLGSETHSIGLFNDTRPQTGSSRRAITPTKLHHLAFEVDTDAELAALAARLKMAGVELTLGTRDGDPELGDTLWFKDPDDNRIEISVALDDLHVSSHTVRRRNAQLQPYGIQHIALKTNHLEATVEFYTEALGFDISDWLLRECAWLRCNTNHHTLILTQGKPAIEHIGFRVADRSEILHWADYLSYQQIPIVWGPGRHGPGNDLFLRIVDPEGIHVELSSEMQQYYDHDVTAPPRLWHTRAPALNLWGVAPPWADEDNDHN